MSRPSSRNGWRGPQSPSTAVCGAVPPVQLVARGFEHEVVAGAGGEVEGHLMGRARAYRGDRPGEARMDRTVEMAAQQSLDLRMARDHAREAVGTGQADQVHVADAGGEGRVMHQDHGRGIRACGQRAIQPFEPLRAEFAVPVPGHLGVDRDQAHRMVVDRVLHEVGIGTQPAVSGEGASQRVAAIVVSRQEIEGHVQRGEQFAQQRVFVIAPVVDQIAGGHHDVGSGMEAADRRHAGLEHAGGIDHAVGAAATRLDVKVGDLADEHGPLAGERIAAPARRLPRRFTAL